MGTKSFFQKLFGSTQAKEDPELVKMSDPISLSKYDVKDLLQLNSVVYLQTQLAFPTDKMYVTLPGKDDNDEIIFVFKDYNDVIYGTYKYIKLGVENIDLDKLIDYYAKNYIPSILFKTIHKTFIDGRESFIVTGKTKENKFDYFSSVIIEGSNLTIFTLITDENFLFLDPDFAYKMFASYKFIKSQKLNQRTIKDFVCFKNSDGLMKYFRDNVNTKGYYITYENAPFNLDLMFGVKEATEDSILSLRDTFEDNESPIIKAPLKFNNIEVEAEGFAHIDWLNFLVKYKGNNIQFSLNIKFLDTQQNITYEELKDNNLWPQIVNIINENFYLNF
jgi:hypothetical protein